MTDAAAIDQVIEKVDTAGWPARLLEVAEVIGADSALLLVEKFGGIRVYVPSQEMLHHSHHLARELGWDKALTLCQAWGGEHIDVPTLYYAKAKKQRIVNAIGSNRAIAIRFGVTEAYVRKLRAGMGAQDQVDLFQFNADTGSG